MVISRTPSFSFATAFSDFTAAGNGEADPAQLRAANGVDLPVLEQRIDDDVPARRPLVKTSVDLDRVGVDGRGKVDGDRSEVLDDLRIDEQPVADGRPGNQPPASIEEVAAAVAFLSARLASGALVPVIAKTFPLQEIAEAHRFMESNQQIGKIVVTTR